MVVPVSLSFVRAPALKDYSGSKGRKTVVCSFIRFRVFIKVDVLCCYYRELLVVGGISAKEQVDALYSGVRAADCRCLYWLVQLLGWVTVSVCI